MGNEEYKAKIAELEKENATLREMFDRRSKGHASAYNAIRAMIVEKVNEEIDVPSYWEEWKQKSAKGKIERNIMTDIKWNLRVRRISDFRTEHIEQAKLYLDNYVIDSEYRKAVV